MPKLSIEEILKRELEEEKAKVKELEDMIEYKTRDLYLALEKAVSSEREKNEIFVNISHELLTPIHIISNFVEIGKRALEREKFDEVEESFNTINEKNESLYVLIKNLVALAKDEYPKIRSRSYQNLNKAIVKSIYFMRPLAKEKNINIEYEQEDEEFFTVFDFDKLNRIMQNLISNCIKYCPEGSKVNVRVKKHYEYWKVEVNDNGNGIPDNELDLMFEKFYQGHKTKTGAGGSGLGLAICKQIMIAHGGFMKAKNLERGGLCVYFGLPIKNEEEIENSDHR